MKITSIVALLATLLMLSCKKERTCKCTNTNGTYDAGTTDGTKNQAKNYCKTLSTNETTCELKN